MNICNVCKTINEDTITVCKFCGQSLVLLLPEPEKHGPTEPVPEKPVDATTVAQPAVEVPDLRGADLALVVRGHDEPVLIAGDDIILGRYDPGNQHPSVDLTPFNAASLGVSRRHARIQRMDDVYLLEDLNSTNGTWINQQRLPGGKRQGLRNGDMIQLGQLVLRLYLDSAEALRSVEERINFRSSTNKLTPQYLATRISPYLMALAEIQMICDEVQQRKPAAIEIGGISMDGQTLISVQITGARDALKLAKGHVKHWRKENVTKINQFLSMKRALDKKTAVLLENSQEETGSTDEATARDLGRELQESEMSLAFTFLREIAPESPGDDSRVHVEKMLKHLHVLAFSPLHVTTGSSPLTN